MKKIITCLLLVLIIVATSIDVSAKRTTKNNAKTTTSMKQPSFAYPKTISKDAHVELEKAIANNDAHQALNALIKIFVAEYVIDSSSMPTSIELAEQTAQKFKDDKLYGLYLAFLARAYNYMYDSQSWIYDRRETPLLPYPEDLTEWSGAQFKAKIKELCNESISGKIADNLALCPIEKYTDLIQIEGIALIYYSDLLQFAYQNAISVSSDYDSPSNTVESICTKAYEHAKAGSAPSILWLTQKSLAEKITYDDAMALYDKYAANQYAGYMLEEFYTLVDGGESIIVVVDDEEGGLNNPGNGNIKISKKRLQYCTAAEKYISKFPKTPFKDILEYNIDYLKHPVVVMQTPSICSIDNEFDIKISAQNANKYKVLIYKLTSNLAPSNKSVNYKDNTFYNTHTPVRTLSVETTSGQPFECDTVLQTKLSEPGYYVALLEIDGKKQNYRDREVIKCLPAYAFTFSNIDTPIVAVVDPVSGKPIPGVDVLLRNSNGVVKSTKKTDSQGLAVFDNLSKNNDAETVCINIAGKEYTLEELRLYRNRNNQDTNTRISINVLTDLSLYHPGDTVQALVIACEYNTDSDGDFHSALIPNQTISLNLLDANRKPVGNTEVTTDDFGRATASLPIPAEGLTGTFLLRANTSGIYGEGSCTFMVSDYKMPDFEIDIASVEHDTPQKGDVTINGSVNTYSGMPIAGASIDASVTGTTWRFWMPHGEKIFSQSVTTEADGKFSITVPDSILSADKHRLYFVANIDAVSPSGSAADKKVSFTTGKYYNITVNVANRNIDGTKPFGPEVKVYAPGDSIVSIPLQWTIKKSDKVIASGDYTGQIDISSITPGEYLLEIAPIDNALADPSTVTIVIFNRNTDIVPGDKALWIYNNNVNYPEGGKAEILYGTSEEYSYVYYILYDGRGKLIDLRQIDASKGYHTIEVDYNKYPKCEYGEIVLVKDLATYYESITFRKIKKESLVITGESFRDNLVPGNLETWRIRISMSNGDAVEGALALDMYNKALEAIYPQRFSISFPQSYTYDPLRLSYISNYYRWSNFNIEPKSPDYKFYIPELYTYGQLDNLLTFGRYSDYRMMKQRSMMDGAVLYSVAPTAANVCEEAAVDAAFDDDALVTGMGGNINKNEEAPAEENFSYRESNVPLAIWAPTLTSDKDGKIVYTFTVPNANTTWRLKAVAWTKEMEIGSLMHEFVASKPVMVQPNLPRFLRVGDEAVVSALVFNKSEEKLQVTTVIELFDPFTMTVLSAKSFKNEIGAKESAVVKMPIAVNADQNAIGYRVKSSTGRFSDGEQSVIKVLPNISNLVETMPFYLNPGETEYNVTLPSHKNQKLTLTFSENPTWTIVTALPGLRNDIDDYANSAAAALFSACISQGIVKENPTIAKVLGDWTSSNEKNSALISQLQKNEDLKIALLNSTPWALAAQNDTERMANLALLLNQKDIDKSIAQSIDILLKLQNRDGGWKWGKWCDESSVWVTSNVLSMMAELKTLGWLPDDNRISDMINKALRYLDNKVKDKDMLYTIIRPQFTNVTISNNGIKVIKETLTEIRKNWESYADPAYKAMAATALYYNKDKATAEKLMGSITEFGVWTKDQGLKFPSVNALYNYAIILDAYATILPSCKEIDGLRQQLIVRKQGTDWGNAVVTTEVVQSILSSGSNWTVEDTNAKVSVGKTVIATETPIEKATGTLRANLSKFGGKQLKVETSGTGPAYGAVFAQFDQKMKDVKAFSCDDLDIEKVLLVRRGLDWEEATDLKVGDRVKVQLTIHCKRNLQYVSIVDERPATFAPVQQLPGWIWSEGTSFYRENRDASTQLHIQWLTPGTYLLNYEMNVGIAGTFTSGVATIQSQYAPEISAHSSGTVLEITE